VRFAAEKEKGEKSSKDKTEKKEKREKGAFRPASGKDKSDRPSSGKDKKEKSKAEAPVQQQPRRPPMPPSKQPKSQDYMAGLDLPPSSDSDDYEREEREDDGQKVGGGLELYLFINSFPSYQS